MLRTASCKAFMKEHFEVDTYDAIKLTKPAEKGTGSTQESNEKPSKLRPFNIVECLDFMTFWTKKMSVCLILQTIQFDDDVTHVILLASNLDSKLVFIDTSKEYVYAATVKSFKALGYRGVASATEIIWRLGAGEKKKVRWTNYYDMFPMMRDHSKAGPSSGVVSVVPIQDQSKAGPSSVGDSVVPPKTGVDVPIEDQSKAEPSKTDVDVTIEEHSVGPSVVDSVVSPKC